jgi:hypothetical protein
MEWVKTGGRRFQAIIRIQRETSEGIEGDAGNRKLGQPGHLNPSNHSDC